MNVYMALAENGLVPSIVHTWNPWHFNFQQLLMLPLLGPGDPKKAAKGIIALGAFAELLQLDGQAIQLPPW